MGSPVWTVWDHIKNHSHTNNPAPVQTEVEKLRAEIARLKEELQAKIVITYVKPEALTRATQDAAVGRAVLNAYRPVEFRTPMITW